MSHEIEPRFNQEHPEHSDTYSRAKQWLAMAGIATVLIGGGFVAGKVIEDKQVIPQNEHIEPTHFPTPTSDNY